VLQGFATDNGPSVLDNIDDWAVPGTLRRQINATWPKIKQWWNTCMTQAERQRVNRIMQRWQGSEDRETLPGLVTGPISDALSGTFDYLSRFGLVAAGLVLLVIGLLILSKGTGKT
jgi:hypothetical protein